MISLSMFDAVIDFPGDATEKLKLDAIMSMFSIPEDMAARALKYRPKVAGYIFHPDEFDPFQKFSSEKATYINCKMIGAQELHLAWLERNGVVHDTKYRILAAYAGRRSYTDFRKLLPYEQGGLSR